MDIFVELPVTGDAVLPCCGAAVLVLTPEAGRGGPRGQLRR
jgi:hypothetical protein